MLFRAISGIAAAAVTTSATSLLVSHLEEVKRPRAFSIFGIFLGIGMISGPLIASALNYVEHGWSIFSISMAFLLIVLFISLNYIEDVTVHSKHSFDWIGGILLTLFLLTTVTLISFLPVWSLEDSCTEILLLTSVLLGYLFIKIEKKSKNPMIDLSIFRNRIFSAMSISSLLLGFGYISIMFYFPYFLKEATEFSSLQIGSIMTIATLPSLVFPPMIAKFRNRLNDIFLLKVTLLILVISPLYLFKIIGTDNLYHYELAMFILGSSFGISLSYIDGLAVSSVPNHQTGLAAGIFNTFRIGGESIFIPLIFSVVTLFSVNLRGNFEPVSIIGGQVINKDHNNIIASTSLLLIAISVICFIFSIVVLNLFRANKKRSQLHDIC
ncbi:MFS transporter [Xenorhabdus sp. SGI246]|uniref:MFS transporter n=1 Tax=Xenorhabdus sp. SGI246 TaxID=3158263 RepID=UPI00349FBB4C